MSKNYLRLQVGDRVLGLKFNIGTLDFLHQLSGEDPFRFTAKSDSYADTRLYVKTIFHAALLSNAQSQRKEPDFTEQDVEVLFNELTTTDLTRIVNMYNAPAESVLSANGEVGSDTQPAVVLG